MGHTWPICFDAAIYVCAFLFSRRTMLRHLLALLLSRQHQSIAELEKMTQRKASNLSRTLRKLEQYGVVRLVEGETPKGRKPLRPEVMVDSVSVSFMLV